MNYKFCNLTDLINDCKANGREDVLKSLAAKKFKYKDKNTGEEKNRKISFIEIKNEYFKRYYPEDLPKPARPKKPTMYEMINKL